MVKTEIDLGSKCRSCFSEEPEMHFLFGEFDQGLSLADILKNTTFFEVAEDDGFSQFLCENCTTIIVDFFNLKTVYQENERYIKSVLTEEECEDEEYAANEITNNCNPNEENCETNANLGIIESKNSTDYIGKTFAECSAKVPIHEATELNGLMKSDEYAASEGIENQDHRSDEVNNTLYCKSEVTKIISSTKYTCDECGDCFLKELGFRQHMIQKHKKSFVNFDKYASDTTIEIPITSIDLKNENFSLECGICKEEFESWSDVEEHYNKVHKKYVCEHCGAKFLKKSYLEDHAEIHTTEKRHVCPMCGKAFRRRTVLVKHKKLHTHPRQCICEICGLRFNDKGTMKTHIKLKHTKERNYYCSLCGQWFPLKSTLDKHIFRHNQSREKPFVCEICQMAYQDKSSLNRHVIVKHTENVKKPSCEYCGKQYSTNTNLLKHIRHYHNNSSKEVNPEVVVLV